MGQVIVGASQPRLPGVIVPKGRRKVDADKVVRFTVVVSRGRDATIRRLADERFAGNMSAAASWAFGLAAVVLDGPLKGLQVPANPADALPMATGRRP
jgi:hypothetical protein